MNYPIVYTNGEKRIEIYADRKIRFGYFEKDYWQQLFRNTVPNLTDAEWYAAPGPEWKEKLGAA